MIRLGIWIVLLTGTYVVLVAGTTPWDIAMGVALAAALVTVFRRRVVPATGAPSPETLGRAAAFFPFAAVVLADAFAGLIRTAMVVLNLREPAPAIVGVPVGERTRVGMAVSALAMTLSPGTVFIDVDEERDVMLFHVIDARDPEEVRRMQEQRYRRYQRRVFP